MAQLVPQLSSGGADISGRGIQSALAGLISLNAAFSPTGDKKLSQFAADTAKNDNAVGGIIAKAIKNGQ